MTPDDHATLVSAYILMGLLALGGLAMLVRVVNHWLMTRQATGREILSQFVTDVKRGEGFTFHHDKTPPSPERLHPAKWLNLVNEDPDAAPHLVIVGGTGTGKTTLATGLLHTRPGLILIITPKTDDYWGGLPYITIDDDGSFTTATAAFKALLTEVKIRLVNSKRGRNQTQWLNVVLDDYAALRSVCPEAHEAFLLIARLGRSLRVRLLVLSYSDQVKELGLEGLGQTRNHFLWLRLDRQRRATIEWDDETHHLDTERVIAQAQHPIPAVRWWNVDIAKLDPSQGYLEQLLEESSPQENREKTKEKVPHLEPDFQASESETTSSEPNFSTEEIARIAVQIALGGKGKTEIVKSMPRYSGRKHTAYSTFYDRLRAAVEPITQETEAPKT